MSRLPLPSFLCACACLLALLAPTSALGAETMRLDDPVTDNYKASYNADPSDPELRTWLALRRITASGTSWAPRAPGSIEVGSASNLALVAADGRSGSLGASVTSGPTEGLLERVDPTSVESGGRWGPLGRLSDRSALRASPVRVALTLRDSAGATLATGTVEYRHDPGFASVASNHIEHNGPGGRWYVGGVATRANWEPAPATRPQLLASAGAAVSVAPRITALGLPLRTTKRLIAMTVRGRAGSARITQVRVRIGSAGWGRWTSTRRIYSVTLPRGNANRLVRVQLRAADGRVSAIAGRSVRCTC